MGARERLDASGWTGWLKPRDAQRGHHGRLSAVPLCKTLVVPQYSHVSPEELITTVHFRLGLYQQARILFVGLICRVRVNVRPSSELPLSVFLYFILYLLDASEESDGPNAKTFEVFSGIEGVPKQGLAAEGGSLVGVDKPPVIPGK